MTWRDLSPWLFPSDVARLESDEAEGFSPEALLFNARDAASQNLWAVSN